MEWKVLCKKSLEGERRMRSTMSGRELKGGLIIKE
jgi:hypothetical protein